MALYHAECPLLSLELTLTHLQASAKGEVALKVPIKDEYMLRVLVKALPAIR
jgi:hypothetical protein